MVTLAATPVHHSLVLSFSSPLPAIQQLICGKFLTHYTLCNVYTPTIMEVIDGRLGAMNGSD